MKNVAAIQERQGCHCVGGGLLAPVFVPTIISICPDVPNYLSTDFLPIISDSLVVLFALCPPLVFVARHRRQYLQRRTVFVIPNLHSASP